MARLTDITKRLLVGRPIRTDRIERTLLPKRVALPVFASDALSSVAYAPQEILLTLAAAGVVGYAVSWQVGAAVALVMLIVVSCYRQNVHAYPSGGGDYEIASKNLGRGAGLVVAGALMVDYVLTVAVSISAASQYASAAVPALVGNEVLAAIAAVAVLAFANLRGVRESGILFAITTYLFMFVIMGMLATGAIQYWAGTLPEAASAKFDIVASVPTDQGLLTLGASFLILRAFSSGCAALTGVEAISNGVPAFQKPKSENAAKTLTLLGIIGVAMFMSILSLADAMDIKYVDEKAPWTMLSYKGQPGSMGPEGTVVFADGTSYRQIPVIAQIADGVSGNWFPAFLLVTVTTSVILVLAANTAFNGFPVLASILAGDKYLPRQLRTRGDRLAYSNGIIMLSAAAALLIVLFDAEVTQLIHLYIVGVFISFTAGQLGMMRHWTHKLGLERDKKARFRLHRSRIINSIGLICTATVLVVVLVSKFTNGAWITICAIAVMVLMMRTVRAHYDRVARELAVAADDRSRTLPSRVHAVVLVSTLHKPTVRALSYARASRPHTIEAITVRVDPEETTQLVNEWMERKIPVNLRVLESPYREVQRIVVDHVKGIRRQSPRDLVVIYLPEYVLGRWWEVILHNQSAIRLKAQLRFTKGVIVASVPWQLESSRGMEERLDTPAATGPLGRHMGPSRAESSASAERNTT